MNTFLLKSNERLLTLCKLLQELCVIGGIQEAAMNQARGYSQTHACTGLFFVIVDRSV